MWDLVLDAFNPVNLLPTILVLLVLTYWLMVIIGVVGEGIADIDFEVPDGDPGPWLGAAKFLYLGDIPIMIVVSLFVCFFWATSVISNYYFNPDLSFWVVLYCLIPNVLVSVIITKLILFPLVPWIRQLSQAEPQQIEFVGKRATVSTLEVNNEFGQIAVEHHGPPIVLNARCYGAIPRQGDVVEIVEYDPVNETYVIRLSK